MNQELFVRATRWVAYAAIIVLLVAVFSLFFRKGNNREALYRQGSGSGLSASPSWRGNAMGNVMGSGVSEPVSDGDSLSSPTLNVSGTMATESAPLPAVAGTDEASPVPEKHIIQNGSISIKVEDADWSADEIERIANRLGGFVESRSISSVSGYAMPMMRNGSRIQESVALNAGSPKTGVVVIRIPAEKFAEANAAIRGIASVVLSESSSSNDITAQFSDLEARIKNKYAEEDAFTKILNSAAVGKVSDVLDVTRELSRVRGEIEQLETEKKYLESQTDMASIAVSLSENARVGATTNAWRPWQTVKSAVNALMTQCRSFVDVVIYFMISVVPAFLLYFFGLYVLYRLGKKVFLSIRK